MATQRQQILLGALAGLVLLLSDGLFAALGAP